MSKTRSQMVSEFHEKLGVSPRQYMWKNKSAFIKLAADSCLNFAHELERFLTHPDLRYLRAHLLLEEMGELLEAMARGDELATLDALADLSYVTDGTAVTFDLPLDSAFAEVHRSNMTKEKQPDDPSAARVRVKGPNYEPPDLKGVLIRHREELPATDRS